MTKLTIFLFIIVVLYIGGDVLAKHLARRTIEKRKKKRSKILDSIKNNVLIDL